MDQQSPSDPEYPFMLWAMGSCLDIPDGLAPDEDRLVARLAFHRLTGRFYCRARVERPTWCSRKLLFAAWKHHRGTLSYFERQLNAAREITAAAAESGRSVIFIKGFAAYALTGNEAAIRHSNDLDIFAHDLPALRETCRSLGYSGDVIDLHNFSRHEYSLMDGHGLRLELHRYAMFQSYPREAVPGSMCPADHPGHWIQPVSQRGNFDLTYERLLLHAVPGRGAAVGIFVPNAEMSALIACAHEFREHLGRPWWHSNIKLAALAEIRDLCHAPGFDHAAFAEHAARCEAQDAVLYAGHLLEACGVENPLPVPAGASAWALAGRFPQEITPTGCWAEFEQPETLLMGFDADVWMESLGPNTVRAYKKETTV
jgi:hypothetical protein